jgi:NitT/TauT family transport system substrate-binding protein
MTTNSAEEAQVMRSARSLILSVAIGLVVAACAGEQTQGTSDPASTVTPDTTAAPATTVGDSTTATSGPASAACDLPAAEIGDRTLQIGTSAVTPGSLPLLLAVSQGIFEERGLDVELVEFEGDGAASTALLAGQIDAAFLGGGPAISAAAVGERIVGTYITNDFPTDSIVAQEEIQSADDLRGGTLAVSTFGGDSYTAVIMGLTALGLNPEDVTIVQIGGQSDRYAALQADAVDAAPMEGVPEEELNDLGLHTLVDLKESGLNLVRESLSFSGDFLESNPNTVLNLVAGLAEAEGFFFANPDVGVQQLAESTGVEEAEAQQLVDDQLPLMQAQSGRTQEEWFGVQAESLASIDDSVLDVDFAPLYDNSFIDQLESEGCLAEFGLA